MTQYNPRKIERKWQSKWAEGNFSAWRTKSKAGAEKRYILDMFPYPSGDGLHVGHVEGYTGTDILARYSRMKGMNVLHPMGWDAFGLPAENYALKMKTNPNVIVPKNIKHFKEQCRRMGFSYDWGREINTTDPNYYKWTQWIFLQLYRAGLAYEAEGPVNFCPSCKTGLAQEDLEDGRCERCGSLIEVRQLRQWYLRITAYADRLLDDLDLLDWPESVKEMQRNWIGKKRGLEINFEIKGKGIVIPVFTTRPETIYGATFIALSPDHPKTLAIADYALYGQTERYLELAKASRNGKSQTDKTGVFTGSFAINPMNGMEIPIWVSDYVLSEYGTGAIMGVPGHDKRDFEFARKFNLPITQVIETASPLPYEGSGSIINSEEYSKMPSADAEVAVREKLVTKGIAKERITYRLRDWLFSRQRYWGEPIPIIKCPRCGNVPVPEKNLPVTLPAVRSYEPTGTGESPLAGISRWMNVRCPACRGAAKREANTMPQWAGSSWYYLRFIDPKNRSKIADKALLKDWIPVDFYVGGVEHATRHLIYARFWHKFLYDAGFVPGKEPFKRLMNQGLILGADHEKMSKRTGNVVNPDDVIAEHGADALRIFEMFAGPFEATKPWSEAGIIGARRFLDRVWGLINDRHPGTKSKKKSKDFEIALHKTIQKVSEDIEGFRFNTAISSLMILQREIAWRLSKGHYVEKKALEIFVTLLSPFAPHIGEELWEKLGHKTSVQKARWPIAKIKKLAHEKINYQIQVNGKTRAILHERPNLTMEQLQVLAKKNQRLQKYLKKETPKKIVFLENRLINFVV